MKTGMLIHEMCDYFCGDVPRINHFLKVYGFAKTIGECEDIDAAALEILEAAAITHDIGIKVSEEKYGSSSGKYQELEGPAEARKLLSGIGFEEKLIQRVCYLIGHHHTYDKIDGIDYQILVEADFLVNIFEASVPILSIEGINSKIFKTETGKTLLKNLYNDKHL